VQSRAAVRSVRPLLPLACLLTLFDCARLELPDQPVLKEYALPQKDFHLASGLRVLVQEDHNSPLVVVTSVYGVGGTADPPGREGLAHLVEHLVFRSRLAGGAPLWEVLKRSGAAFNASTAAELTTYYAIAHKQLMPELLQIEAWRLTHTLDGVTDEVFEVEREVVRNELRQRSETTIGNRLFDELLVQLYPPGHPLGRPLAGTHASLSAVTLDDARRFVAQHYRPENCTVVVAGDVQADAAGTLLGKWPEAALFGPGGPEGPSVAHRAPFPDLPPPAPPPHTTALRRLKGPVEQPILLLGWSAPGGLRGHDVVLSFAGAALNLALATGIERKEDDYLGAVTAAAVPLGDGSIILVQARLRPGGDPEKARARILDAVSRSWSSDLSRTLVRRGKWGAATTILRASSDPVTSGLAVSQYLATTGRTAFYTDSLQRLAAVQPSVVLDFAYHYLTRERAAAVFFEPEGDGRTGEGAAAAPRGRAGEHELGRTGEVNLAGMKADDIRRIAPPPGVASLPRFTLANGLRVVAIRRAGAPLAEVYLRLPGGDATVTPYGLASVATARSSSLCPDDHGSLREVGGALGVGGNDLASVHSARVMSGNLSNALAVLADDVSCREAREQAFVDLPRAYKETIERYRERQKRPQVRAARTLWAALYPDHPFGLRDPDPATLTGLTHADATAYLQSHFRPGGALAVVVADVSVTELRPMVEKYFGRWTGGGSSVRTAPPAPPGPTARTLHLFDRPGATQSSLQIGCRTAPVTAETLPAFDLLEALATEKAWDLRESWGATYGISASVSDHPGGAAHLLIEGNVETARTGDAVGNLLALLATFASDGPDFKSFMLKRWDLAREYARNQATATALVQSILRAEANGWPPDLWDRYPSLLADTSRASVRQAVEPCAGHEVITIVGDATAVRPQLEAHGLHAVEPALPPGKR
jgi:zinc protease